MKIAIHGRSFTKETQPYIQALFDILKQRQIEFSFSASFYSFLLQSGVNPHTEKTYPHPHDAPNADFIFSIGGDGTLLESVMQARSRQIPILGINTGRLGFLATVSPAMVQDSLEALFSGKFQIEDRTVVSF